MRIAIFTNSDVGLYKFRKELLQELCRDCEVYIVLPDGEFIKSLEEIGCRFIPFEFNRRGTNPLADVRQIARYVEAINKIRPNVVLTYTIKPNCYGGIACQFKKVPYIVNVTGLGTTIKNGGLISFISTTLYKLGLRKSRCVFFQNSDNLNFFVKKGITNGKTRLIPGSGVNLEKYRYEKYPDESDGIQFLFVGRIMKDKGIEELLYAIRAIRRERPDATVDVVGWCDEDYARELQDAETEGTIRFHGFQSDVGSFYRNCHCAVLPSYHEGTANVMLEASATGRPVITTRVPGCRETFDDGVTGFGCEAKDGDSLKNAMLAFLSLSQEDRRRMGVAARAKMVREYDRKIVIDAYRDEIENIKKSVN